MIMAAALQQKLPPWWSSALNRAASETGMNYQTTIIVRITALNRAALV